ncbi:hypothetical protein LOK49_LG09G00916 [Camellia lanceoleosa]|uniref:Uncharacterized protein n=1 Tax=Camellia lanceoleosa TaxID=1840588 RepID=A0ACC0GGY7_9ERIC|nr:hypothetical protein LOK49_LG09G00916 [Camellia lanceoleosa]
MMTRVKCEKKSIGVANDVPTFNAENMQNNMKAVYYCRTFMCIIGGVVAVILGFTGLTGFIFYFLVMAITSVGTYFVRQYYQVLQQQPNFVHQFYNEASTMLRIDGNSRETATAMLNDHDPSKLVAETPCGLLRYDLCLCSPMICLARFLKIEVVGFALVVFNVVDQDGNKISDEGVINYIQKVSTVL